MISREQLLTPRLPVTKVMLPELGPNEFVYVRTMTAAERDGFESSQYQLRKAAEESAPDDPLAATKAGLVNFRARLCVRCISDETGTRMLTDDDADVLGTQSAAAVDRIFAEAKKLNGFDDADVDELAKN